MNAIYKYGALSAPEIIEWIREENFPAAQNCPYERREDDTILLVNGS